MPDIPINPQGFLHQDQIEPAGKFVRSLLWTDFRRALASRAPQEPQPEDPPHVAAAKAFKCQGWRSVIDEIEKLPFDSPVPVAELIPETIRNQAD